MFIYILYIYIFPSVLYNSGDRTKMSHIPHMPCNQYWTIPICMHKILQARLQQYVNHELPDVQPSFRKGRGTRDQTANTHWIIEKAREFQKKYLLLLN